MAKGHQFGRQADLSSERADSIRRALDLVIRSDAFAGSKQCQDLLRLLVQHALSDELDALSEQKIGVEMFGRPAGYDTSNDAVVRVRATEVRKRLAQYYDEAADPPVVRIEVPPDSYVPEFHWSPRTRLEAEPVTPAPSGRVVQPWRSKSVLVIVGVLGIVGLSLIVWLRLGAKPQSTNQIGR